MSYPHVSCKVRSAIGKFCRMLLGSLTFKDWKLMAADGFPVASQADVISYSSAISALSEVDVRAPQWALQIWAEMEVQPGFHGRCLLESLCGKRKNMEKPRKIGWKPSTSGIWSWDHVDLTWSYHQKCDCTPKETWNLKDSDPVRWCSALGYGPPEEFHSGSWFQPTYPRGVGGLGELMGRTGGNMWRPSSWLGKTAPTLGANLMGMICDLVSGFLGFWVCVLK